MTKEQILQKHFTAEFGHDGHGKFMQYILDAMEEYAQQQINNLYKADAINCDGNEHKALLIDFNKSVEPAIRYLLQNHNPHTSIYIHYDTAELLTGEKCHNLSNEVPD